jgi:hypothetical protein
MNFNLKKNIMTIITKTQKEERIQYNNSYDAFLIHIDSIYFEGASEVLEPKLLLFEYANFKESYEI